MQMKMGFLHDDVLTDYKSKKLADPHVRIVGKKEEVLRVKDKIMAVLDAKVSEWY